MYCMKCGKEIPENEARQYNKHCKNCHKKNDTPKQEKKKHNYKKIIIIAIISFILLFAIIFLTGYIQKEKKLTECYLSISQSYDYDGFKKSLSRYRNDEKFYNKAYSKLNDALEENINKVKNGDLALNDNNFEKAKSLFDIIIKDKSLSDSEKEIVEIKKRYFYYYYYYSCGKSNTEKEDYILALNNYDTAKKYLNAEDTLLSEELEQKVTELRPLSYQALKDLINKYMDSTGYTFEKGYKSIIQWDKFIEESDNDELKDLYRQVTEKNTQLQKEKKAQEKARRKSQGVRIGMTKQEVLDSSWGEPKKINTSTNRYGTHEQWVYGNGNYLYFDNGKLTSIQN